MSKIILPILLFLFIHLGYFPAEAEDKPVVFVSILPQKYFVQKICRDRVEVEVMVQPGASPHTYEPKASQMTRLAGASAYFAVGVSFEDTWLDKLVAVNPHMRLVRTDANIQKIAMASHHDHGEEEGGEHGESQGTPDPHTWLSPVLAKAQVQSIADSLVGLYPEQADFFKKNTKDLLEEIARLDARLRELLQDSRGRQFMVYHPAWGYFAREYGLQQVPVEIEGKQPKPAQLQKLIERARRLGVRVIFVQPQFSRKSADIIAAEIGGEAVFADPLAEDWPANLLQVAGQIEKAGKK